MAYRLPQFYKTASIKVMKSSASIFALGLLVGCASTLLVDPSIPAVQAGDYTLIMSACENAPGIGMDICRVNEGTQITSSWRLIIPRNGINVLGGEINVYYRDIQRSYGIPAGNNIVEIPWGEIFGSDRWNKSMDGEALALVSLKYKDAQGVEKFAKFRGIAKIVVTDASYARMPIDSGVAAWPTTCKIEYSTSGRAAMRCR
jgi:hypothetical protein